MKTKKPKAFARSWIAWLRATSVHYNRRHSTFNPENFRAFTGPVRNVNRTVHGGGGLLKTSLSSNTTTTTTVSISVSEYHNFCLQQYRRRIWISNYEISHIRLLRADQTKIERITGKCLDFMISFHVTANTACSSQERKNSKIPRFLVFHICFSTIFLLEKRVFSMLVWHTHTHPHKWNVYIILWRFIYKRTGVRREIYPNEFQS